MAHDEIVKASAKTFWEGGNTPAENMDSIKDLHNVTVADKTLRRWADEGKWKDWKKARKERSALSGNPNVPFGVTGIQDPIFHLCEVLARREVRADSGTRSTESRVLITNRVLATVRWTYQPGPLALDRLKPRIMDYITAFRRNPQEHEELQPYIDLIQGGSPSPEQPPNQPDFVANVPTGGLQIDEQHAALGMVYTTEEQEGKEE